MADALADDPRSDDPFVSRDAAGVTIRCTSWRDDPFILTATAARDDPAVTLAPRRDDPFMLSMAAV
jgi:hypothetical protein